MKNRTKQRLENLKDYRAMFVLKGDSEELKDLCDYYSSRSENFIKVEPDKFIISSEGQINSSGISDHLDWIIEHIKNDINLIKKAVDDGDYISFSYFYPGSKKPFSTILEPSTCGYLNKLNAPLFLYESNKKDGT